MLPAVLETDIIKFTHESLGHIGTTKCIAEINRTFHMHNLGRKVRKYVASRDTCQRVKHPNRSYKTEWRSHLPTDPGVLCSVDIYGPLPKGRGGVKYILVLLDVFSKYIKLYALKSATTKACLNRITGDYITNVIHPKRIHSDNATNFASPLWKPKLNELRIEVTYSPIRPQSNTVERYMSELGKFFRIY
jgi:hypothetical protein